MSSKYRTVVFIDAGCLRPGLVRRYLKIGADQQLKWPKFMAWLSELAGDLRDCHYYDSLPESPSDNLLRFHNFLGSELKIHLHMSSLQTKTRTCPQCKQSYSINQQRNVDMEIATDMLLLAPHFDQAILISCDGDFATVARKLRERFARQVTIVAWKERLSSIWHSLANNVVLLDDHAKHFITPTRS